MNPNNGPAVVTLSEWMRQMEKQSLRSTRRPRLNAATVVGPGVGPYANEVRDWSGDQTAFNGFYYSRPGSFNSPDSTKWWVGHTVAQIEGFGIQEVWDYRGVSSPPTRKTRRFSTTGATRVFSAWA